MTETKDVWPAGATYVFFGTVAEDATGGTHVTSLVLTPTIGSEFQVLYGEIVEGNTATSQTAKVFVDDAANELASYLFVADTAASKTHGFPVVTIPATNVSNGVTGTCPFVVSGAMRLVLQVTTTAVSVTQTFAVVCRVKGSLPTATLADTVGIAVTSLTTNKVF